MQAWRCASCSPWQPVTGPRRHGRSDTLPCAWNQPALRLGLTSADTRVPQSFSLARRRPISIGARSPGQRRQNLHITSRSGGGRSAALHHLIDGKSRPDLSILADHRRLVFAPADAPRAAVHRGIASGQVAGASAGVDRHEAEASSGCSAVGAWRKSLSRRSSSRSRTAGPG